MRLSLHRSKAPDYPVVPLKETVVFPHTVAPVLSARKFSISAVEDAMAKDRQVLLCIQTTDNADPQEKDFARFATVATVLQIMKLPDGSLRILVEGKKRCRITGFFHHRTHLRARVEPLPDTWESSPELDNLARTLRDSFSRFASLQKKIPAEVTLTVGRTDDPHKLVDLICGHSSIPGERKLELLSETNALKRVQEMVVALESENEVLELKKQISSRVRKRLEKGQRDYFLNEQMKEIHRELGREDDDPSGAADILRRLDARDYPDAVSERVRKETDRLRKLQPISPEAGIVRTYLDWLLDLPWNTRGNDQVDLTEASEILESEHYAMEKPKERILDYIAVRQLTDSLRGPILCFVGPPGTGKTSLAQSLAHCLSRSFVRISLGGVRDEAEIRGHRRTYVGALPGKIIQSIRKAGTRNPVFLLDEIDKLGMDFRGDPASALLEVLDPEQNVTFVDHYIEVPFDLSDVIFITTANTLHTIPYALRDRMEVIEIPGYTEFEKRRIAEKFLIPKQLEANGLTWLDVRFRSDAIERVIRDYTMESGVRNLERELATVVRKIAREAVARGFRPPVPIAAGAGANEAAAAAAAATGAAANGENGSAPPDGSNRRPADSHPAGLTPVVDPSQTQFRGDAPENQQPQDPERERPEQDTTTEADNGEAPHDGSADSLDAPETPRPIWTFPLYKPLRKVVTARSVAKHLGKRRVRDDLLYQENRVGVVNGLAWTELGGRTLAVEASVFPGSGNLRLTGSMGDVMKESAYAAFSFIRTYSQRFCLASNLFETRDIHVHVPEGAIPKDGPSAGITIAAAMVSAFSGIAVQPDFAMTGEITLSGRLLQIGGVKEKALAAHRNGIANVLMPEANRSDSEELPDEVTAAIEFHFASSVLDALRIIFPPELFEIRSY